MSLRIGIVAYWFNRGQGVVARRLRSALDELGHESFVLARPTRKTNIRPGWIDSEGVWAQEGVTAGSDYLIPSREYEAWAGANSLDAILFDQNYQFEEIAQLRRLGVRTVGRFVWEHFSAEHVEPAREALDTIYSMTACEQRRYAEMGIESPRVRWGCPPDLTPAGRAGGPGREAEPASSSDRGTPEAEDVPRPVSLLFPGGFMSKRKPIAEVIEAFRAARGEELRLVLKAQVERQQKTVKRLARGGRLGRADRRIELITDDLPTDDYMRLFGSADALIAPSRWEGLGLHLYEATALGIPVITNDDPPMNEVIEDGVNGILVASTQDGQTRSGVPSFSPEIGALTEAIERIRDPALRERLSRGALRRREELSWETTVADLGRLLDPEAPDDRTAAAT